VFLAFRTVALETGPTNERRVLMRDTEFAAIRPHLKKARDDIDDFLNALKEKEKVQAELCELYDLIVAGKTPPEVKGRGKPVKLTPEQYAALDWQTVDGKPITAEERETILADVLPGQPVTDEQWDGLQFTLRGGWQKSSRVAAAWLRNAGETVVADGIDVALDGLSTELRDAREVSDCRNARRVAAERVKSILTACLAESADSPGNADLTPPTAKTNDGEEGGGASSASGKPEDGKSAKRNRGRPADTDPKQDKRIYEAWKTGQHKTQADCDRELGLLTGATYAACERHRKRLGRRNKRRRTK
jgi:hypothetical protein